MTGDNNLVSRKKQHTQAETSTSIPTAEPKQQYTVKKGIKKEVQIIPRNIHQEEYLEYLLDPEKMIVIAQGIAGCGKSLLAMLAGIKFLSERKVNKLILCRPSVGVDDEDFGFLPGDLSEKLLPWVRPLLDVMYEYYSKKDIENMLETGVLEFAPLMYMRGRNIKNAFCILDEAQNTSISQCKSILTRLCENSKLVITGDNDQSDRKSHENGLLFLGNAIKNYGGSKNISFVNFDAADNQRSQVVQDILEIFKLAGR